MDIIDTWSNGDKIYIHIEGDNVSVNSDDNTNVSRAKFINLTAAEHGLSSDRTIRVFQKGNDIEFIPNACKDYDGNWYDAIRVGSWTFTASNLRVTHFNDGTPIAFDSLEPATEPSIYNGTGSDFDPVRHGYLYSWGAISSAKGLAPAGWKIPQMNYYGGYIWPYLRENLAYSADLTTSTAVAKCVASSTGWIQSSGTNYTVGKQQELNNCTGFNAYPVGTQNGDAGSVTYLATLQDSGDQFRCGYIQSGSATLASPLVNKTVAVSIRLMKI